MQPSWEENIIEFNDTIAYLKKGTQPLGILVLHDYWGIRDSFIDSIQKLVSKSSLMIPDLFDKFQETPEKIETAIQYMKNLKLKYVIQTLNKCKKYLETQLKITKFILVGFSMGAALGLRVLQQCKDFSAAILFYGIPKIQNIKFEKIQCPVLYHFGESDKIKGFSDSIYVQKLKKYLKGNKIKIKIYDGQHGFMNKSSKFYNKQSSKEAIQNSLEFIRENTKSTNEQQSNCQLF